EPFSLASNEIAHSCARRHLSTVSAENRPKFDGFWCGLRVIHSLWFWDEFCVSQALASLFMGKTMNLKQYVGALVAAVLLGSSLVGCAVEDEKPEPYEPQVTHTPKAKKTDDAGAGEDGLDDGGTSEDSTAEPGSDLEA